MLLIINTTHLSLEPTDIANVLFVNHFKLSNKARIRGCVDMCFLIRACSFVIQKAKCCMVLCGAGFQFG